MISEWIGHDSAGAAYTGDTGTDVSADHLARLHVAGQLNYLMVDTRDGSTIGTVGWARRGHSRAYSVAVIIGENQYWQQGHGGEAFIRLLDHLFQTLDAWRVEIITAAYNPFTISAFVRQRVTIEGILRDYYYVDGQYHDATVWSILRGEYFTSEGEGGATAFLPYLPLVPVADKARARSELRGYLEDSPNASWLA